VRSEGIATANFWKDMFATNRCIVPASYSLNGKTPRRDRNRNTRSKFSIAEFFGIAGVWAEWKKSETQKWEKTFATFTSEPNGIMRELHDRQPVILDPKDFQEWLSPSETLACSFAPHPTRRRRYGDTSSAIPSQGGEVVAYEGTI